MPFKEVQRVMFKKCPLLEVVCQFRFPTILKINDTPPADFQDAIRSEFPIYGSSLERQHKILMDNSVDISPRVQRILPGEQINNYYFTTENNEYRINLTSTFISLTTSRYTTWEDFSRMLDAPLKAFIGMYRPAYFERVGLRYIDGFSKEKLDLKAFKWHELINSFALGFMSLSDISDEITSHHMITEISLENNINAQIITATGYVGENKDDLNFIFDSDVYTLKTEVDAAIKLLDTLHSHESRLLRAILTDKLYDAMEPIIL